MKKQILLICILLLTLTMWGCSPIQQRDIETEVIKESEKVEISMEEAIKIGEKEADNYYENLKLTEAHSYDNDYSPSIDAGKDGKREWWYVNFANKDLNYVNILIRNGEIVAVENFDENGNNGLLDLEDIVLTSPEAARKAKELGLQGGDPNNADDWVSGYNFKLSYSSLRENTKDIRIFLEVIGISPNGNFAHIDFDAATGEVLLKEEKIEHEDETVEWKSFCLVESDTDEFETLTIDALEALSEKHKLLSIEDFEPFIDITSLNENGGIHAETPLEGGIEIWGNGELLQNMEKINEFTPLEVGDTIVRREELRTEQGINWLVAYTDQEHSAISYCFYLNKEIYSVEEFLNITNTIQLEQRAIY